MSRVVERFLRYIKIDTSSSEESDSFPSTEKQFVLARLLADELREMGARDVYLDDRYCYVYATIPASIGREKEKVTGFIAHMDTSPETTGTDVKPQIIVNYDGKDIPLGVSGLVLSPQSFPELKRYVGLSLITASGDTLLGGDDKAGIAEIMTMAEKLLNEPGKYSHGEIRIAFTPDEEIGSGVDRFDVKRFGADYAYTVDGGALGELEYENFNAASLEVQVKGVTVHPGEAKDKMKNASRIAMEFDSMLPAQMRPENTSGYEGFFHLCSMTGNVEDAFLSYIIRDHSRELFENKKKTALEIADIINEKYGADVIQLKIEDSYYNMREKIEPNFMFLVDNVSKCMKKLSIEPVITPIRGGTDGARLSFMGLPCPNICTGGHNFHGKYEYICIESMEKISELLTDVACNEQFSFTDSTI